MENDSSKNLSPEEIEKAFIVLRKIHGRADEIIKNSNGKLNYVELSKKLKIHKTIVSSIQREGYKLKLLKKQKNLYKKKTGILKHLPRVKREAKNLQESDKKKVIKIKKKILSNSTIPFLDNDDENLAYKMAEPYILLYLLENSLRKFIDKKLTENYGEDWWKKINIKNELKTRVTDRKRKEKENKWHVPRGANEIFYTDLKDLTYLLNKEEAIFEQEIN
jgi:hypothetical protein